MLKVNGKDQFLSLNFYFVIEVHMSKTLWEIIFESWYVKVIYITDK